jgi:hypothetical protein
MTVTQFNFNKRNDFPVFKDRKIYFFLVLKSNEFTFEVPSFDVILVLCFMRGLSSCKQ